MFVNLRASSFKYSGLIRRSIRRKTCEMVIRIDLAPSTISGLSLTCGSVLKPLGREFFPPKELKEGLRLAAAPLPRSVSRSLMVSLPKQAKLNSGLPVGLAWGGLGREEDLDQRPAC